MRKQLPKIVCCGCEDGCRGKLIFFVFTKYSVDYESLTSHNVKTRADVRVSGVIFNFRTPLNYVSFDDLISR